MEASDHFPDATAAPPAADKTTMWSKPTGSYTNNWRKQCRPSGAGWRKTGTSAREPKGSVPATSLRPRYDARSPAVTAYNFDARFVFVPNVKTSKLVFYNQPTKPNAGTSMLRDLPTLMRSHGCQFNVDQPTTMASNRILERQRCGCCVLLCS